MSGNEVFLASLRRHLDAALADDNREPNGIRLIPSPNVIPQPGPSAKDKAKKAGTAGSTTDDPQNQGTLRPSELDAFPSQIPRVSDTKRLSLPSSILPIPSRIPRISLPNCVNTVNEHSLVRNRFAGGTEEEDTAFDGLYAMMLKGLELSDADFEAFNSLPDAVAKQSFIVEKMRDLKATAQAYREVATAASSSTAPSATAADTAARSTFLTARAHSCSLQCGKVHRMSWEMCDTCAPRALALLPLLDGEYTHFCGVVLPKTTHTSPYI